MIIKNSDMSSQNILMYMGNLYESNRLATVTEISEELFWFWQKAVRIHSNMLCTKQGPKQYQNSGYYNMNDHCDFNLKIAFSMRKTSSLKKFKS